MIAVNRDLIPAAHLAKVSRTSGWISPVVLYAGRVAGVWNSDNGRVTVDAFEDIPAEPLAAEIDRISSLGS